MDIEEDAAQLTRSVWMTDWLTGDGTSQRVLVPGAGLGRLPLEIAARGYSCQGNEFSYFMLLTRCGTRIATFP